MTAAYQGFEFNLIGAQPADADKSIPYQLLRLLIGTATIRLNNISVEQRTDFSNLMPSKQSLSPKKAVDKYFSEFSISTNQKKFIRESILGNRQFFKDILCEYAHYFYQTKKQSHTAAFVYIYRIMERMFYSVPLIYTQTQNDYYATFKELKEILNEEKVGEMGLYKKIVAQGKFIDKTKLDLLYTIDFSSSANSREFYNLTEKKFSSGFDSADPASAELKIKFREIPGLLTLLRNRFFHTRTGDGQANIRAEEIVSSDEYFKFLNPIFCSYLSVVILHIIAISFKR